MNGIGALSNAIRMQALLAGNGRADDRDAEVTSYDPVRYAVKVKLHPEGFETGWCQIESAGVGSGWGLLIGPTIGQACKVAPVNGSKDNWKVTGFCFNDVENPPNGQNGGSDPVQSGEILLQDESGTLLRFNPGSGQLLVNSNQDTDQTVGRNLNITVTGNVVLAVQGDVTETVQGNVSQTVTGTFTGSASSYSFTGDCTWNGTITATGDVKAGSISLEGHDHIGVTPGGGTSGGPTG